MNGDIFENSSKTKQTEIIQEKENNFFLNKNIGMNNPVRIQDTTKHLNDYDSNILKEDAYREVNDDVLKLEYKISRLEKEIKDIDGKISVSKDIGDYNKVNELSQEKIHLEQQYKELLQVYHGARLSAKISSGFTDKLKEHFSSTQKIVENISDNLLSKLPGKFGSFLKIKNSLSKLENINKSVDELMNRKYPYGEFGDKYEQLSKYISRANIIQSEISKIIK